MTKEPNQDKKLPAEANATERPVDMAISPLTGDPEPFDPFKYQIVPVSPELRRMMTGAKLSRIDPELLKDTAPPNRPLTVPGPDDAPSATEENTSAIPELTGATAHKAPRRAVVLGIVGGVALVLVGAVTWILSSRPAADTAHHSLGARTTQAPDSPSVVAPSLSAAAPSIPPQVDETAPRDRAIAEQSTTSAQTERPPPVPATDPLRSGGAEERERSRRPRTARSTSSGTAPPRPPAEDDIVTPLFP